MKTLRLICSALVVTLYACSSVDDPENLEHFMVHENSNDGQLEYSLRWTVNGVRDDGMFADLNIYLSPSIGIDSSEKNNKLNESYKSSLNYYGGAQMIPSRRSLPDFYRYYIGVAFNGILAESVVYPLTIEYTLTMSQPNVAEPIKVITGAFDIDDSNDASKTFVHYNYRMDITTSADSQEFRSYSIRKLEKPILEDRLSDVVNTTTFPSEYLYINFLWKGDNEVQGYQTADLDLYLHDITKDDIDSSDDLEEGSTSEDSYELITTGATKFTDGVARKFGYYYFKNIAGDDLDQVKYMYKIYSFSNNKIQRYVQFGSFDATTINEDNSRFYFAGDITWSAVSKSFKVTPAPLVWEP